MLLSVKQTSLDRLVSILATRPGLEFAEIQHLLRDGGGPVSRPQLFRELHELQSAGVAVSIKGRYSLSLAWIVELIHFSDAVHEHYLSGSKISALLSDASKRKTWRFFEYCRLSNFWNHLRLALAAETESSEIFEWIPHPWQHLIHHEKALLFYKALGKSGCRLRRIVGNDSYLDQLHVDSWPKQIVEYSFAEGPFSEQQNLYFDVIGDYVFEISIMGRTFTSLQELYDSVKNKSSLKFERITELLYEKGRFVTSLERNPRKAERLRKQFREFFD